MFTTLMASAPNRRPFSLSAWGVVSTGLHGGALFTVLWLTGRSALEPPAREYEQITYLVLPDEPAQEEVPTEPPPEPPPSEEAPPLEAPVAEPLGFQELPMPREIAPRISAPGLKEIRARDFTGVGVAGGVGEGRELVPTDTIVAVAFVDEPPRVLNVNAIGARMQELYPATYRMSGIEGRAVVQMVVNAEGRVEEEGLTVLNATHPEFLPATRQLVKLLRFEPGTVNGHPVRVMIQMPVDWIVD